ncbi:MAG: hypothetical protein IIA73_00215 [Proteobacteria bacterium]|nr:hypothetical protein [Pseudomonadota bacterium]
MLIAERGIGVARVHQNRRRYDVSAHGDHCQALQQLSAPLFRHWAILCHNHELIIHCVLDVAKWNADMLLKHFQLTFTQVKGKQRSIATQALVAYATARGRGLANSERFHSF